MSEKLCLQWNDFKENVNAAFGSLREDTDFTDVTLVCEDGQQIAAHKVILASSSPFFQNVLKRNKHSQPLIYMKGAKFEDLSAVVDFLYYGEANVFQENLDSFLSIAEELKLKGLTGQTEDIAQCVFGYYVYLPTEQAETYLKSCVLINYSTCICLCLFGWKVNMILKETVTFKL